MSGKKRSPRTELASDGPVSKRGRHRPMSPGHDPYHERKLRHRMGVEFLLNTGSTTTNRAGEHAIAGRALPGRHSRATHQPIEADGGKVLPPLRKVCVRESLGISRKIDSTPVPFASVSPLAVRTFCRASEVLPNENGKSPRSNTPRTVIDSYSTLDGFASLATCASQDGTPRETPNASRVTTPDEGMIARERAAVVSSSGQSPNDALGRMNGLLQNSKLRTHSSRCRQEDGSETYVPSMSLPQNYAALPRAPWELQNATWGWSEPCGLGLPSVDASGDGAHGWGLPRRAVGDVRVPTPAEVRSTHNGALYGGAVQASATYGNQLSRGTTWMIRSSHDADGTAQALGSEHDSVENVTLASAGSTTEPAAVAQVGHPNVAHARQIATTSTKVGPVTGQQHRHVDPGLWEKVAENGRQSSAILQLDDRGSVPRHATRVGPGSFPVREITNRKGMIHGVNGLHGTESDEAQGGNSGTSGTSGTSHNDRVCGANRESKTTVVGTEGSGRNESTKSGRTMVRADSSKLGSKRNFPCQQCGFVFGMRSNLKRHILTVHEDRRGFECPVCKASFGLKQNLVTHVRVKHERRRPFRCDLCNMSFGYKQVLQNHVRNIHNRRAGDKRMA